MIFDHFDPVRAGRDPDKADAPLLVDANAELSRPISPESFKPVARR
jgi:hypothetical protein